MKIWSDLMCCSQKLSWILPIYLKVLIKMWKKKKKKETLPCSNIIVFMCVSTCMCVRARSATECVCLRAIIKWGQQ